MRMVWPAVTKMTWPAVSVDAASTAGCPPDVFAKWASRCDSPVIMATGKTRSSTQGSAAGICAECQQKVSTSGPNWTETGRGCRWSRSSLGWWRRLWRTKLGPTKKRGAVEGR